MKPLYKRTQEMSGQTENEKDVIDDTEVNSGDTETLNSYSNLLIVKQAMP